jgi:hypothetical protein
MLPGLGLTLLLLAVSFMAKLAVFAACSLLLMLLFCILCLLYLCLVSSKHTFSVSVIAKAWEGVMERCIVDDSL